MSVVNPLAHRPLVAPFLLLAIVDAITVVDCSGSDRTPSSGVENETDSSATTSAIADAGPFDAALEIGVADGTIARDATAWDEGIGPDGHLGDIDAFDAMPSEANSIDSSLPLDSSGLDTGGKPSEQGPETGGSDAAEASHASDAACANGLGQGAVTSTTEHLDIPVHDPSMIWDGSKYFLLSTGGTLAVRSSPDLLSWTNAGNVLDAVPAWVKTAIGTTPTDLWAPDISYFNGQFYVYYAASTFGSNDSVIGLATTASLETPEWADKGLIVQSTTADSFNAIDPNVSFDATCTPWIAFGSFWNGIKLRRLEATTGKLDPNDTTTYSLASRNGGAIEAASIISHNGYYYLLVSFDACCKGVNSTYRTMVGRASAITGPYTDKAGANMMTGAAEQLLATTGRYIGPGGGTAWKNGNTYLYAYHYYDGDDSGVSKLQVRPITFDANDWIVLQAPVFP